MEWFFGNYTLPLMNEIGDTVKNASETANITFSYPEAEPLPIPNLVLASTYVEPAQESNGIAYAGVAFGVIAVLAAGALYKNCRSQKVNSNQEALL